MPKTTPTFTHPIRPTPVPESVLLEYARLCLRARDLQREHASIVALDASRGDVAFGRGELTLKMHAAERAAREAADAILDGERE